MKKYILSLFVIVAAIQTTVALQENPALFVMDLLKSRTRMKAENGEYGEWKKWEKLDNTMGIYQALNGDGKDVIKFVNMKKKVLFKTYKYSKVDSETKDEVQSMIFEGTDNYNEPIKVVVSYYPSSASLRTAKWLKVTEISKNYEREYEAKYL